MLGYKTVHTSIVREVKLVPRKTHRIWNGRPAPDRLAMSFSRYPLAFMSYNAVKVLNIFIHTPSYIGSSTRGRHSQLCRGSAAILEHSDVDNGLIECSKGLIIRSSASD